jgi:hypothetical protein
MMNKILIKIFLLLLFFYSHVSVHATSFSGSSANAKPQFPAEKISGFSKKVEQKLAQEGVRVAILARMGRPLSEMPEGMHFTHVAFAVYSSITLADGSTHQATIEHPRGSSERPLSDDELAAKYRANAALGGTTADVEGQIAALWALDRSASIAPLMALLNSPARNAAG